MMKLNRRHFLQLGAAAGALAYVGGRTLVAGGAETASKPKQPRQAIPSSCFQCPAICGIIGYVQNGRLVKIEGNPAHPNNQGVLCAKGQAGMSQAYDAQRILYPMKQTKERGDKSGWRRISWDEALDEVAKRIKKNMDEGRPDKIFFMPGRDRSAGYLKRFADAVGSPHVISRSGTCSQSKKAGFMEVWGYDSNWNDFTNTRYILNFGHGLLESGSVFAGNAKRIVESMAERGTKMVTVDPMLSNTAAKSTEWVPIQPGTDLAMALAMHYVIIKENLVDPTMVKWFNYPLADYLKHLENQGYTPEWAAKITGIPAATITRIAREFATIKPGCITAYKGIGGHTNGAQTTKAVLLLAALTGNLNVKGGTNYNDTAKYKTPAGPPAPKAKKTPALKSNPVQWEANTVLFENFKAGKGEVDMIVTWVHNPVYVLGNAQAKIEILKDRKVIPYFVAIDLFMSESTALADIILPDLSFLERNDPESHYPLDGKPWVAIRQPVIKPVGQGMEQTEILRSLAHKLGPDVAKYFDLSRVDYVKAQVKDSVAGFEAWGGYEKLKEVGAYYDPNAKPSMWGAHEKTLKDDELKDTMTDEKTGLVYKIQMKDGKPELKEGKPQPSGAAIGVKLADGKVYKGWKMPDLRLGIFSASWDKQFPGEGLPKWTPSETVAAAKPGELLLIQYKFATITHSRTSNNKWLSELTHDNPIIMNPADAVKLGLKDGDRIVVTSAIAAKEANLKLTEGIRPGVVATGWGPGHWEYGAFATAGKRTLDESGKPMDKALLEADPDYGRIWWKDSGTLSNWWPAPITDQIGGNQEWTTPVSIKKA